MYNWEYNFLEKHLGKTKFWKLYEGNRVFRYIFKVLAVILMFLLLCANFYIKNMIGILEIPVSIIVIFIYIFLLAMVVNIRSDTTLMVALRFFLDSVIILAMVGLLCFLITNNIFPRPIL